MSDLVIRYVVFFGRILLIIVLFTVLLAELAKEHSAIV